MTNIVDLGEYRARNMNTAASAAVDDLEETSDRSVLSVSFTGTPDEIFDQVLDWLATTTDVLPEVVITRPGFIEFANIADNDDGWRDRYDDSIWEETMPSWDLDDYDGEAIGAFDTDTLSLLIRRFPVGFKVMVTGGLSANAYNDNDFVRAFYHY